MQAHFALNAKGAAENQQGQKSAKIAVLKASTLTATCPMGQEHPFLLSLTADFTGPQTLHTC
eukprot:1160200-Pelagomonas_calceolata.AAC.10